MIHVVTAHHHSADWIELQRRYLDRFATEGDYYVVEDVPHTMYFNVDIALHGAYWHDRFGYKHSHGCVNMPLRDAEWVYFWSENAPNDLWVWVHTSDPMNYFETNQG